MKDVNGNKITSEREKTERRKENFRRVLNCDEPAYIHTFGTQPKLSLVDQGPIRIEEVKEAPLKQRAKKSPGQDLISAEMFKVLGNFGLEKT